MAGAVFYMLLGISLFEGNMVASGFESYLVAFLFCGKVLALVRIVPGPMTSRMG